MVPDCRRQEEKTQGHHSHEASEEDDEPDGGANPFVPIDQQLVTAQVEIYCHLITCSPSYMSRCKGLEFHHLY